MQLSSGYEDRKARIEMIPLMDVIFLLLSSFIYATLSLTAFTGLRVNLPRGAGVQETARSVVISIAADSSISMGGETVSMEEAVARATAALKATPDSPVLVSGDRSADLGVAVELLSALRKAEVTAVSFQVKPTP